jgi:hypothetical protein
MHLCGPGHDPGRACGKDLGAGPRSRIVLLPSAPNAPPRARLHSNCVVMAANAFAVRKAASIRLFQFSSG